VLLGEYLRRNNPATNGKDLSPNISSSHIHAEYIHEVIQKEKR